MDLLRRINFSLPIPINECILPISIRNIRSSAMKSKKYVFILFAVLILALTACGDTEPDPDVTVYVAGGYMDGGKAIPCYWEDGVITSLDILPDGASNVGVVGMAVSEGNIYMAARFNFGIGTKDKPYYWKIGDITPTPLDIPDEADNSYVFGITAQGENAYMSGNYRPDSDPGSYLTACYWKNGEKFGLELPAGATNSIAHYIAVQGEDIYVFGEYWKPGGHSFCYWVNDVITDLAYPAGADSVNPTGFAVEGNKVCISGYYQVGEGKDAENFPFYWENGTIRTLSLPAGYKSTIAEGITVQKGTVYICGYYSNDSEDGDDITSIYWKNDKINKIAVPEGALWTWTNGIAVNGSTVYIIGGFVDDENNTINWLWENGTITILEAPLGAKNPYTSSIVLVRK